MIYTYTEHKWSKNTSNVFQTSHLINSKKENAMQAFSNNL